MILSAVAAPLLVANTAHDACQKGEQRHTRRSWSCAGQRAQDCLMQQVGPRHTLGERAGTQPGDRAQAQQIFLRKRGQRRAHVPRGGTTCRPQSLTCCDVPAIAPP